MKFSLGVKRHMTQIFDETGRVFPVTIVRLPEQTVTQEKTKERDGYRAVQVSDGKHRREWRLSTKEENWSLNEFAVGDMIRVSAISKGKGFQGVIKRHGFSGGPRSHGQKHSERAPGSIGTAGMQRVIKGMRMGLRR